MNKLKANKKDFYGYITKKKNRKTVGPLVSEWGREPRDKGDGKNNILCAFFALVFTGKTCSQEYKATETSGKVQRKEYLA